MRRIIKFCFLIIILLLQISYAATRYVSKSGNDGNNGGSWSTAWATISKVNSSMSAGDTVFFGSGTWWGQLQPVGGTYSDRTTYACSSFVATNGDGEYHFARIFGGDSLANWNQYSGNVYSTSYSSGQGNLCLAQGDSIIWQQGSLGAVDEPGEYYFSGSTIYAYIYNTGRGYDPDSYDMEVNDRAACYFNSGVSYVTLYGLRISYAKSKTIEMGGDNDSVFIEHCKVTHGGGGNSSNAAAIHFPYASDWASQCEYCKVVACSLAYGYDYRRTTSASSGHGGAISIYGVSYLTVESCNVYGYFSGDVIDFKGHVLEPLNRYNTIKYNKIMADRGLNGIRLWSHIYQDSIYGNIIGGTKTDYASLNVGIHMGETDTAVGEYVWIYNNTIYNCRKNWVGGGSEGYGDDPTYHKTMKYNVFYQDLSSSLTSYSAEMAPLDYNNNAWDVIDSNLYFYPSAKFSVNGNDPLSWASWQGYGYDVHSPPPSDPLFNNAVYSDFSRPSASNEMNRFYGGQTWTLFGAVQTGGPIIEEAVINVAPASMNFYTSSGNPPSKILSISNVGNSTLYWTLSHNSSWLSYNPGAGTDNGQVDVSIDITGLGVGTYHDTIAVTDPNAYNNPVRVPISLIISETNPNPDSSNIALGLSPVVSGTYSGYNASAATDGDTVTTWASDSSPDQPHWIYIDFGENKTVNSISVYWAWNSSSSSWMNSQQITVQAWNGNSYYDVKTVNFNDVNYMSVIGFNAVQTSRIRLYQPGGMGPANYTSILWIGELQIYYDTIAPASVIDFSTGP